MNMKRLLGMLLTVVCIFCSYSFIINFNVLFDLEKEEVDKESIKISPYDKVYETLYTQPEGMSYAFMKAVYITSSIMPPEDIELKDVSFIDSVYYRLTEEERKVICQVVMAEAGAEPYKGKLAVAQCILDGCIYSGLRPIELIKEYKYTSKRKEPSEDVIKAVSQIFDDGYRVVKHRILYFYAPRATYSKFHESQLYIITIGNHKFFDAR